MGGLFGFEKAEKGAYIQKQWNKGLLSVLDRKMDSIGKGDLFQVEVPLVSKV